MTRETMEPTLTPGVALGSGAPEDVADTLVRDGAEYNVFPLSFAQERLWFLEQLHPGTGLYNLPAAVRIGGPLSAPALGGALDDLIERHETLRTAFIAFEGRPFQSVLLPRPCPLALVDLEGSPDAGPAVKRHATELAGRPFDLRKAPLLRATLFRLGPEEHVLLLVMHHIVSDGWSLGVLVRDTAALYDARIAGRAAGLPELEIQYADFAVWQREVLSGDELEEHLGYWRDRLADLVPLELPSDRPRPDRSTFRGEAVELDLGPDLSRRLLECSSGLGAPPFLLLLASLQALLARHSGRRDVAVGTPTAGRTRRELEDLVGFFVNTLVMRTDLEGDPTFHELVQRVRHVAADAYSHQDLPFEKLVAELEPERQLGRNPLFQVLLVLHNEPLPRLSMGDLRLELLEAGTGVTKLDLRFALRQDGEVFRGALSYAAEVFERSTAERLRDHWLTLLQSALTEPERRISHLPLMAPKELEQVRSFARGAPLEVAPRPVHELFEDHAAQRPDAICLVFEDERLSYGAVARRAERLVHLLRACGVGPEDRVGLLLERRPGMIVALLAVMRAGAAYVPLDPESPPRRWALQLEDSGARVVVGHARLAAELPGSFDLVPLDEGGPQAPAAPDAPPVPAVTADRLAYVLYTSGSTGRPKGVAVSHRNLHGYVQGLLHRLAIDSPLSFATVSTLAADLGNTSIFAALTTGGELHLLSEERITDGDAFAEYGGRRRIDCLKIVPSHLAALLACARPQEVLPQHRLILGGEAATWSLVQRCAELAPACRIVNHYGPTEATVGALAGPVSADETTELMKPPLGNPLPGTEAHLLDRDLQPVPVGVPGQLHLGGSGLSRGYLHRPARTAAVFVPHPDGGAPGARLYATGDAARSFPDGRIEFLGRIDQQVKIRGFRVEPGEVEATLVGHPGIAQVAVAPVDTAAGLSLAAFVVAEAEPAVASWRAFASERLPGALVPAFWQVVGSLPRTANGKVDRRRLPSLRIEDGDGEARTAPRTATEELVAGVWSELLGRPAIGAEDDFFRLGGHSLLASRVVARIRRLLRVELPVRALFEAPTLAALAERVDRARSARPEPPFVVLPRDGSVRFPLSYSQERLWFLHEVDPDSAAYNLPYFVALAGRLDLLALRRSLRQIVERHEILRTAVTDDGPHGQPGQRIHAVEELDSASLRLPVVDVSGLPAAARNRAAAAARKTAARRSFDLTRAPLFRAFVLRLAGEDHQLLMTLHHIVSDAWSRAVLTRELGSLYHAARSGTPPGLPELQFQYADFAHGQRRWLEGGVLDEQLGYWRDQLAGLPPLELPTDRPRPAVRRQRGAHLPWRLDPDLSAELVAFGRRRGATLFMVLLAAFEALLFRYTRQRDFAIGSPVANRERPEIEGLIGLFINVLVLRARPSSGQRFLDLLGDVRTASLDAFDRQDVPFERLVEALAPARDLSRSPLFQVMLILQNADREPLRLPDLELQPLLVGTGTSKFDLTLIVEETAEGLHGSLEYDADLFAESTAGRWMGHLRNLLGGIVRAPGARLDELPLLTAAERGQLLVDWNATERPFPHEDLVQRPFEEHAAAHPGAEALVFEERSLPYVELDRRANRLAHHLRSLGVGPEVRVALFLERSPELAVALLAVLKAGGAYVPVDTAYPPRRIALILEDSRPALVLTGDALAGRLRDAAPQAPATVLLDRADEDLSSLPDRAPEAGTRPANTAYVIYTSGSTGRPKGVAVTHRNVLNFFSAMDDRVGGDTPGTWLAVTSLSFDISVLEILWTLGRGFKVVLLGEMFQRGAASEAAPRAPSTRPMELSLFYFASDSDLEGSHEKYRLLMEGARWADRNGFTAVWTPERHFHAFGGLYPNPSVVGAAIAAVTERIRIRAGSVVLPLHHPVRVAEDWSVVDNLSGGRVDLSFASGWHADDFVLAPGSYGERREVMFRSIEQVRRLWRGETLTFESWKDQPVDVTIHPKPVQAELPVWVTAAGNPSTFERAGALGAGVLTHLLGQNLDELREKLQAYRAAWRAGGHPGEGRVTLMLHTFVGEDLERVRRTVEKPFCDYLRSSLGLWRNLVRAMGRSLDDLTAEEEEVLLRHAFDRYFDTTGGLLGTPETCLAQIERLKELGVDEIGCLIDFGIDPDTTLAALDLLGEVHRRAQPASAAAAPSAAGAAHGHSFSALARRHGVTHLQCTPSMARVLALEPETAACLSGLQTLLVGGEALPDELAETLHGIGAGAIHNMYGPTETTVWSTSQRLDGGQVTLGRPIANTRVYLTDGGLRPVPAGIPGELLLGGQGVVRGYLGRPALTAERFLPDPFAEEPGGQRLYRTGDRGRYRADGEIEFLGRVDHQIKIRGHRIEPGEIEAALNHHPRIEQAVVVGREELPGTQRLVAYFVPAPGDRTLVPALPPSEQERLLARHKRYVLPNGMPTAVLHEMQASLAYTELFAHRAYFRHSITLQDGDCVFDVGANVGFFTLMAHLWARKLRVHAFEPIPPTFEVLRANVDLYGLDVDLHDYGLSWRDEEVDFTFYPMMSGLSGRYSEKQRDLASTRAMILHGADAAPGLVESELDALLDEEFESHRHRCRLRTLSDVIAERDVERIDLLKIDVERAELDVLRGIRDEHWPRIRQIVMEVDTRENLEGALEILSRHGYSLTVEELVDVPPRGDDPEVFVAYLYARSEEPVRGLRYIKAAESAPPSADETEPLTPGHLRRYLEDHLPPYMVPSAFVPLETMPLTPNGKVDRRALPAPQTDRPRLEADYQEPSSDLQRSLAAIWQELLGVERVGIHDNFFELGGSSLLLVEARTRIRDALGVDVTLVDLFRDATVASLARRLEEGRERAPEYRDVRAKARRRRQAVRSRRASKTDGKA